MESQDVIQVNHVTKCYRLFSKNADRVKETLDPLHRSFHKDYFALKDVSFSVKKGETVGIIGKNGSGKSTILKILTGITAPTEGTIHVEGKVSALLELGAGFNPEYTGRENIFLNGMMMNYSREQMEERAPSIIEFADIGEFIDQPVKTYSSGMFARLAFATAINVEPDILIVDEVLSVGDVNFQMKCLKRMNDMMKGGTTVLFVSHDMNVVRRFCTYGIWLENGQKIAEGEVNDVVTKYLDKQKIEKVQVAKEKHTSENLMKPKQSEMQAKPQAETLIQKNQRDLNRIAKIEDAELINEIGKPVTQIELDEPVLVKVTYSVYREDIEKPVLGVAIKDCAGHHMCGVNTLLDKVRIPWRKGTNSFYISYPLGVRVLGGEYYFDVGLFEETATTRFDYIERAKEFRVITKYIGEGRVILPHSWKPESK